MRQAKLLLVASFVLLTYSILGAEGVLDHFKSDMGLIRDTVLFGKVKAAIGHNNTIDPLTLLSKLQGDIDRIMRVKKFDDGKNSISYVSRKKKKVEIIVNIVNGRIIGLEKRIDNRVALLLRFSLRSPPNGKTIADSVTIKDFESDSLYSIKYMARSPAEQAE